MPSPNTPHHYTSKGRALLTTISRTPWRHRRRVKRQLGQAQTAAEKATAKQARISRKVEVNDALQKAVSDVWGIAERVHKELGTHSAQYWYEYLTQSAGKKEHERNASEWNAFLSMRVKAINAGTCLSIIRNYTFNVVLSMQCRACGGGETSQGVRTLHQTLAGVASDVPGGAW